MESKNLDWIVGLFSIAVIAYLLFFRDGNTQPTTPTLPKHDTTYIVKEYVRDTIVNIIRPKYYDTTLINNITVIDSVFVTKPFSLTDTAITKKFDTVETVMSFPQMSLVHMVRYSKDSVKTVTNTLYIDKIVKVPEPEPWYKDPAIGLGSAFIGYLIGSIK